MPLSLFADCLEAKSFNSVKETHPQIKSTPNISTSHSRLLQDWIDTDREFESASSGDKNREGSIPVYSCNSQITVRL